MKNLEEQLRWRGLGQAGRGGGHPTAPGGLQGRAPAPTRRRDGDPPTGEGRTGLMEIIT